MAGGSKAVLVLGAVAALAVVPFVLMSVSSDVEGTLTGRGDRFGPFELEPNRCRSGQPLGFFGVEVSSSAAQEHKIRLIRDPVEGPMVAYERAGQGRPAVLRSEDCRTLDVQVIETNTIVNSIYVVKGSASIDCDELVGSLTFGGCS